MHASIEVHCHTAPTLSIKMNRLRQGLTALGIAHDGTDVHFYLTIDQLRHLGNVIAARLAEVPAADRAEAGR